MNMEKTGTNKFKVTHYLVFCCLALVLAIAMSNSVEASKHDLRKRFHDVSFKHNRRAACRPRPGNNETDSHFTTTPGGGNTDPQTDPQTDPHTSTNTGTVTDTDNPPANTDGPPSGGQQSGDGMWFVSLIDVADINRRVLGTYFDVGLGACGKENKNSDFVVAVAPTWM
jgi:hypothetical protein